MSWAYLHIQLQQNPPEGKAFLDKRTRKAKRIYKLRLNNRSASIARILGTIVTWRLEQHG